MDWLTEFANSRIAKRVVFANYMDHLRLKNESSKSTYSSVEEALQDFAQRAGLTEMQKRGLRRQTFVKIALNKFALEPGSNILSDTSTLGDDANLFESDNAPAAILPGVKPGSEEAKLLEQTKKRKNIYKKLRSTEPQQANTDIEDRAHDEAPGTNDGAGGINANFKPGLVIEAAEGDWMQFQKKDPTKPAPQKYEFKGEPARQRRKSPGGGTTSKEKNLLKRIQEIQTQLVKLYMEPGGSISNPKWRSDLSIEERKKKIDLQSQLNESRGDLIAYRSERKEKEEQKAPSSQAARNNTLFLGAIDKELGVKDEAGRNEALKKLSPVGLQDLYDKVSEGFREKMYYKESQGHDDEVGDFVKCMIHAKDGVTWYDKNNPGRLPIWHLEEHADELLGGTEVENYRQELVDAYLRKYPGAALQSREHELATFVERLAEKTSDRSLIDAPHVATSSEKNLNYTDDVLLDHIKYQFKRFGVDPDDKTIDELAQETLKSIKDRLNEEFPGSLTDKEYDDEGEATTSVGQVGKLENRDIPFDAFHRAFREEVGEISNEYRGTFSNFRAPTRKMKRRWTQTEKEQERKKRFEQLRREDIVNQLVEELERTPTADEIQDRINKLEMVPVNISVTGQRGCWNCGNTDTVLVPNRRKVAINSATCPQCGVYREVLIETKADDPESGWDGLYVIRDINENNPGGVAYYIIYEDDDYIGDGPKAVGNSKFVHRLSQAEQEVRTQVVDKPLEEGQEQYQSPLSPGDKVFHENYGNGKVAFIEGSHIWVAFDDSPRTARIEDLEGEVIDMRSSKQERSGSYKIESVNVDHDMQTVEIWMRSPSGQLGTRHYNNLEILNQQVPVATEVSLGDLQKVTLADNRLKRQRYLLRLAQGKNMIVKVERYVNKPEKEQKKPEGPAKYEFKVPEARLEWLRGRVKRSRLLQRIYNSKWSVV